MDRVANFQQRTVVKVHDVEQGSVEWANLRAGKVTASEMDRLVSASKFEIKKGAGPKTYLAEKVAEAWQGAPLPQLNIFDAEQGTFLEEIARPAFTVETGLDVREVGFITGADDRVGCSPDGLIGDDMGLEIKSPRIETHIRYLLDGVLPQDYVLQVQGSLYITGFKVWKFFSYRRNCPPLVLTIERDEKIQDAIDEAVDGFLQRFDAALKKLIEMNNGFWPARDAKPYVRPTTAKEIFENDDILV